MDITNRIEKMIYRLFPNTLVYTDFFYDYYDDEDVEYNVRITYKLSEETKIKKDDVGGVKPYIGNIVFDILKIESTTYDNRDEYQTFYYEEDFSEVLWEIFSETLYEKIEMVIPFLYTEIKLNFKTRT